MKKATWKELKAAGVNRCNAMFTNGKQCRRRAVGGSSWCAKHGPMIEGAIAMYQKAIDDEAADRSTED